MLVADTFTWPRYVDKSGKRAWTSAPSRYQAIRQWTANVARRSCSRGRCPRRLLAVGPAILIVGPVAAVYTETNGQFSPDGKWIAYQSDESGRFEIYVQPFPGPERKTLVSSDGGVQARWRQDAKELFYLASD